MHNIKDLALKMNSLLPHLGERSRRLVAAAEARSIGRGGIAAVSRASGLSRATIAAGMRELESGEILEPGRARRPGGGRKTVEQKHPGFAGKLDEIVRAGTRGDPGSPLRWTCKSTRAISRELVTAGMAASHETVARELKSAGFSLQGNGKIREGGQRPDCDAQFRHIAAAVAEELGRGRPVLSVDTKKKELAGNYANKGRQWLPPIGAPDANGHDFPGPDVPRALPCGIYGLGRNTGFVNVGTDHDTPAFAAASIRGWWRAEGRKLYPGADRITVTAGGGGSNGSRLRAWKFEIQKFADETGLAVSVLHFPPGTSKWNKIEHRLFSFISSNWRGEPLADCETVVSLIAGTTTAKGLAVTCRLDRRKYPAGAAVSKKDFDAINLVRNAFHGEWNYEIRPRRNEHVIS
jgi:hypothetical protein